MTSTLWNPIFPILSRAFSCRSFNLIRHFEPQTTKEVGPNDRNNRLPKSYELMMRIIHDRIGPTQRPRKRLYTILLSRRENKMSESVRMSTPEGRALIFKRLIDGRKRLWPHAW